MCRTGVKRRSLALQFAVLRRLMEWGGSGHQRHARTLNAESVLPSGRISKRTTADWTGGWPDGRSDRETWEATADESTVEHAKGNLDLAGASECAEQVRWVFHSSWQWSLVAGRWSPAECPVGVTYHTGRKESVLEQQAISMGAV